MELKNPRSAHDQRISLVLAYQTLGRVAKARGIRTLLVAYIHAWVHHAWIAFLCFIQKFPSAMRINYHKIMKYKEKERRNSKWPLRRPDI